MEYGQSRASGLHGQVWFNGKGEFLGKGDVGIEDAKKLPPLIRY